ncbi:hypothetical protein PtA15_5A656 [Puccinia triticina]|uniref:Ras-GAP domain-containing protein n=1 Tax=Puccinia triticina TaxID=208348 RepID=A0ABY7CM80_9BASI|nr:uncharacterized protein PtA15_5A656 [Puccinia triticina]WAQ85082.1 hypothetical protein PtA15_5A656 [Puccinia triticina]
MGFWNQTPGLISQGFSGEAGLVSAGTIHSTASPNPNSTPSEDKLIDALVNKIMAKLSNQADPHLSPLETDELIRQSCSALFEMCCQRLPCVIQKLLQELDSPSHPFTSDEQTGLVDHLRTQLFVIKILCYCMSYHWAWHREQLDDNLAKQLVATISFFLKEHQRFEDAGAALGPIGSTSQPSANYEAHRKPDEKPIVPSLMGDILTQVSKICFFVSASNWTIVLGKIKNRIAYWSGPEEFPDRSETRLLEFCSLNRHRLSSIVRELSAQFVHLKRAAQADIALALRRSIWNWIETYPNEYASLVRSNGRLEGAPDVLFDVAHGLSENGKKRTYTWPMMAMLLAVCPDIVLKITVGDRNRSQVTARKAAFIESLRKHLKAVKMTDVATACCVDLCKAATFSPKMTAEGPGLRLLALDLVGDLNSRLLDPSKPFTNSEGVVEIPLMSEALAALCKLDRHFVDTTLLEKCLSRTSFVPFQIAFIQACHKLDEDDMANWNVKLKELYPAIASSLRHVFMSAVLETNQFHILMRSNSKLITGGDESGQKTELVRALLNLWTQDTTLAFFLNSRLASGHDIDPDDLEMFVYLTTLLLNNRNPRPVRQAAMTVLRAYHQPSSSPRPGAELLPLGLRQARAIVGIAVLKALLETWVFREEEREVLQLLKAYLDRFKEAVEWSERGHSPGFPFASESHAHDWLELISVFEKHPPVLRLCGLDASLSAAQLSATLQGLPDDGKGLGGRVAQAKRAKLVSCISAEEASRQRANRDLSIACLKALAAFYDRLKLVPRHALLRGNHTANNEVVHVRLFSRHYDYLSFLLTEVTKLEAVAVRSRKGKMAAGGGTMVRDFSLERAAGGRELMMYDGEQGGGGGTPEHAAALQRELASITREIVELAGFREQTMHCLVKLMAANIDPAFRYFVNMFHHPDNRIKQANIQILWEVVKEGGHLLPDLVKPVRPSGLDKIVDMITRPDLTLALAICKVCGSADFEEMTEVILNIFDHRKGVIKFLKASIEREVAVTDHESTVFRGNSFTTRLLTIFARAQGYDYLRNTLSNLLVGLANKPSEFSVDFDPHRASADDDEAARNLEQVTEAFLNVIAVSWKKLPCAIREICHHIATTVQEKYPESVFTSIGGFIFLRFINPAIVSPEVIDLDLPNDTREIRRSLVMITKVLQALSNNIRFSAREPAMKPLNPFMAKNVYPMTRFLKDISSIDEPRMVAEEGTELQDELAPVPLDAADRYVLHRFLYENQEKLGAELKSVRPMEFKHWHDGSERLTPTLGHEIWAEVVQTLQDIGPPANADPDLPLSHLDGPEYHAFLAKYELNRPPDPRIWQALFFEAPRSRLQTMPTFVFLTSRLKAEMCDLESFYLYILQAVDAIDGPFALFLDCTGFTFANEISLPWFRQLIDASPALPALHLAQIWVYNANAIFRRYIRKLGATEKQERRWTNLVRAVSTLDELAICLPNYEQVLPASSWNMFHDKRVVISHVTHLQQYQMQIPVVLHIGSKTLLIRSSKRLELLADAKCTLNDVIRLKDIEEMQRLPPSNVHLDPGFIIKQYGSNVTMKFVSVNTDRIIETLANTQADLLSTPQNFDFRPRSLTPATIYGSLLNGAIFNLCSSDSLIRMAALSFLQGLTRALRIDKIEDVIPFQGGYIPRLGLAFISDISDRLARAVPSATFPFLDEFFITLPTASASEVAVYAHAVKSWLQNLSNCLVCPREEFEYARNRVKNILRRLIELTLCQQDLQGLLHGRIWPSLARQESLLPLIIEELAMSAITHGSNSARFTEVCEIAVSGNCINLQGKLLHRLRRAIGRTTAQPVAMISDSPEWPEITALVRMEMSISFSAHIQAQLYLPDILHIVTMLVGTGLASQRSAIYAIVINTLTCLCSLQGPNHEASALYAIIKRLGLPATQALFGLYPNDLALRYTEDDFGFREPISPVALESIVQLLIEAVKVASPAIDTINRWRSRWASLVTSTCFQANPALQPRAFVVLGYLLTEEVDDDLLFQVLSALKPALGLPSGIDRALATSIISCGAKVLAGVASNSPYRSASFWTGVTLLQLEDPAIYAAALKLTRSAVHDFCQSEILGNQRLSQFLLDSRDDGTVEVMGQIEEVCGLRFDNGEAGYVADGAIYFGFALASSMIKGLRHAQIAQDAEEFLELLLALPYFVVLLPIAVRTAKLPQLFALAHVDRNGLDGADLAVSYGFIINQLRMSDHETALLVVAVFTTMISSADDEAELVFLYNILAELVHRDVVPHIMLLVQTELAPRVQEIMRTSENTQLLNACQAVMFPHHPRVKGSQFLARLTDGLESSDFISVLSTLGFSGLLLHNCFGDEMDDGHHDLGAGPPAGLDHLAHPSHLSSHLANGGAGREYDLKIARLCVCLVRPPLPPPSLAFTPLTSSWARRQIIEALAV